MLRPSSPILREHAAVRSSTCWMRWMCEAKVATMMRPVAASKRPRSAAPTSVSEPVRPGRPTLVESEQRQSTPRSPSAANCA